MTRHHLKSIASAIRHILVEWVILFIAVVLTIGGHPQAPVIFRCLFILPPVIHLTLRFTAKGQKLVAAADKNRVLRFLDILTTNVAIFFVLLTGILHFYVSFYGGSMLVRDNLDSHRLPPYMTGRIYTNKYGYPGREFFEQKTPGVQRIAVIGDSFAVGDIGLDDNFPAQIEKLRPKTEVYNFGIHSTGPPEYSQILSSDVLRFHPDVVIVGVFVGNDITEAPPPNSAWMQPESYNAYLFLKRVGRIIREAVRLRSIAFMKQGVILFPAMTAPPTFNLSYETYRDVETERIALCRVSQQQWFNPLWAKVESILSDMSRLCHARQIKFGIFIIPDEFQVNPQVAKMAADHGGFPMSDLDLDLPQRKLMKFCRESGIPCLDLKPYFQGSTDLYLPQDTHFNEKGAHLAAEQIVHWLDTF